MGCAIGLSQGFFIAKLGVPSFVVTLAGLLAWNGVVLQIVGSRGTIVIQDNFVNGLANNYMSNTLAWVLGVGSVCGLARGAGDDRLPAKAGGAAEHALVDHPAAHRRGGWRATLFVIEWADTDRGIPWVGAIMLGPARDPDVRVRSARASAATCMRWAATPRPHGVPASTSPA